MTNMSHVLDILKEIDTNEHTDTDIDIDVQELEMYAENNYKNLLYHLLDPNSPEFQVVKYELTPVLIEFFDNLVQKDAKDI